MRALNRKLARDLIAQRGQALSIAAVLAAGVAMYAAYFSTFDSLRDAAARFYADCRFADVFVTTRRAPLAVRDELARIDGVADVEARIVVDVTLDVPGFADPISGRIVSLVLPRRRPLNDVNLRRGRDPEPGRTDEVLVNEAFANAHGLRPGDQIAAIINGRRRPLDIAGIVLSPEYVYSLRGADIMPDPERFGILWMERRGLAAAFDMEGGFNDAVLALAPGASLPAVIAGVERALARYGTIAVTPRARQLSNFFLENEFMQLRTAGLLMPAVFLGVAIFLLNVSLMRMTAMQREQIAALRAIGYSRGEIGRHYAAWCLAVAGAGGGVGLAAGSWIGAGMVSMYRDFFHFPVLEYRLSLEDGLAAMALGLGAGLAGAAFAVRRATSLAPAEAMRPAPPERIRATAVEHLLLPAWRSPAARMVLRNVARHPLRSGLAMVGVATAVSVLIIGLFLVDAIENVIRIEFESARRYDLAASFVEPRSGAARFELQSLPGVTAVEVMRATPVRLRHGHRSRETALLGLDAEPVLSRVLGAGQQPVAMPGDGVLLVVSLAEALEARPGDVLQVDLLEHGRDQREVRVAGIVTEIFGASAYMDRVSLARLLHEAGSVSTAFLRVTDEATVNAQLKQMPSIAGVSIKRAAVDNFHQTLAGQMYILVTVNVIFAMIIAFGVVYNAARILLSERSRDLASLRVLGFTRQEVRRILLGEIAIISLVGIPAGVGLGQAGATWLMTALATELFRFPMVITPRTRLFAMAIVALAAIGSSLVVGRRIDRLDLVAVLKTRE
ncbi:MAG TPA: ABC transporter permease [Vicinamibacterales bacterium]|nr:ABC transporter permease [Vicinamibacterales bacterium]